MGEPPRRAWLTPVPATIPEASRGVCTKYGKPSSRSTVCSKRYAAEPLFPGYKYVNILNTALDVLCNTPQRVHLTACELDACFHSASKNIFLSCKRI